MELRHLRYFVSVAEALSFTRAAERLHVAQPALSRQIRQLEEELGVALFDRDRRQVRLTQAGSTFLLEARTLLEQSEQAIRSVQSLTDPHRGTLNVAYVWGLFHSTLPRWVQAFRAASPEVAVHLFDLSAIEQAAALKQGRIDLGFIGFETGSEGDGLARRSMGPCAFMAALPHQHPATRKRRLTLSDLRGETFFGISEETYPGAAHLVTRACAAAGFPPRLVQTAARGHTLLALVAAQCGVALVPETLEALPHDGVILKPLHPAVTGDVYVAWSNRRAHPLRDAFLRALPAEPLTAGGSPAGKTAARRPGVRGR